MNFTQAKVIQYQISNFDVVKVFAYSLKEVDKKFIYPLRL